MFDNIADFEWPKCPDGYLIQETPEVAEQGVLSIPASLRVIARSATRVMGKPLKNSSVYHAFSRLSNAKDLLSFIRLYGPLTIFGALDHSDDVRLVGIAATAADGRFTEDSLCFRLLRKGDGVDEMLVEAQWFRHMIELSKSGGAAFVEALNSRFDELRVNWIAGFDAEHRVTLQPRPESLLDGLRLQMMAAFSKTVWRECKRCKDRYPVGLNGMRTDKEYCGVGCRSKAS